MAAIGHVGTLPRLKRAGTATSGHAARSRQVGWVERLKIFPVVLGILAFGSVHWLLTGYAYGQSKKLDLLSVDQLMARDCHLTPQQVIALVEEQLSKSLPGGKLWGVAVDALTQSLTGCLTSPEGLLVAARQSKYFNSARSSNTIRDPAITFAFLKKDRTDDFNLVFNVCTSEIDRKFSQCRKNQIRAVSTAIDHYRWP